MQLLLPMLVTQSPPEISEAPCEVTSFMQYILNEELYPAAHAAAVPLISRAEVLPEEAFFGPDKEPLDDEDEDRYGK